MMACCVRLARITIIKDKGLNDIKETKDTGAEMMKKKED